MLNTNIIEGVACSDWLKKYTYKMCRFWKVPRRDVDDLVQEVRAEILASAERFQPDMGHAIPWCRGIARNKVLQYLDQCTRRQAFSSTYDPDAHDPALLPPSPEARTLRKEAASFFSDAFEHELSERDVNVIISHTVDEMPHAEISEELHISVANSRQCHKRALEILACCIPNSLRAMMPLDLVGCDDASRKKGASSRMRDVVKWSHYAGQMMAAILACLVSWPVHRAPPAHEFVTGQVTTGDGHAMYRKDNPSFTFDEPWLFPKPPVGKLEPAPLSSVPAVSVPKRFVGKRIHARPPAPSPAFIYTMQPAAHRPGNIPPC